MILAVVILGSIYLGYRFIRRRGSLVALVIFPPIASVICGIAGFILRAIRDAEAELFDVALSALVSAIYPILLGYPAGAIAFYLHLRERKLGTKYSQGPRDPQERYLWANRLPPYD